MLTSCNSYGKGGRDRERGKDREREKEREKKRERKRKREKERGREREKERERRERGEREKDEVREWRECGTQEETKKPSLQNPPKKKTNQISTRGLLFIILITPTDRLT